MLGICPVHGEVLLLRRDYLNWWECPHPCSYVLPDEEQGRQLVHWTATFGTFRRRHSA